MIVGAVASKIRAPPAPERIPPDVGSSYGIGASLDFGASLTRTIRGRRATKGRSCRSVPREASCLYAA